MVSPVSGSNMPVDEAAGVFGALDLQAWIGSWR
jgi:hypothetical protein